MPRQLRLENPCAICHVTSCGDRGRAPRWRGIGAAGMGACRVGTAAQERAGEGGLGGTVAAEIRFTIRELAERLYLRSWRSHHPVAADLKRNKERQGVTTMLSVDPKRIAWAF